MNTSNIYKYIIYNICGTDICLALGQGCPEGNVGKVAGGSD